MFRLGCFVALALPLVACEGTTTTTSNTPSKTTEDPGTAGATGTAVRGQEVFVQTLDPLVDVLFVADATDIPGHTEAIEHLPHFFAFHLESEDRPSFGPSSRPRAARVMNATFVLEPSRNHPLNCDVPIAGPTPRSAYGRIGSWGSSVPRTPTGISTALWRDENPNPDSPVVAKVTGTSTDSPATSLCTIPRSPRTDTRADAGSPSNVVEAPTSTDTALWGLAVALDVSKRAMTETLGTPGCR